MLLLLFFVRIHRDINTHIKILNKKKYSFKKCFKLEIFFLIFFIFKTPMNFQFIYFRLFHSFSLLRKIILREKWINLHLKKIAFIEFWTKIFILFFQKWLQTIEKVFDHRRCVYLNFKWSNGLLNTNFLSFLVPLSLLFRILIQNLWCLLKILINF